MTGTTRTLRTSALNLLLQKKAVVLVILVLSICTRAAEPPTPPEPLPDPVFTSDTLQTTVPDSLKSTSQKTEKDSSVADSATQGKDTTERQKPRIGKVLDTTDTSSLDIGGYFGAGFGWSLGGSVLMKLWETSLPGSLADIGLSDTSFRIIPDSTTTTGLPGDTADLVFTTKEKPAIYTMSFPLSISYVRIGPKNRRSLSLCGSWMHKLYAATVSLKGDTVSGTADFRQSIHCYSLFLSALYGKEIDPRYLSIDGLEKCYLSTGIDLTPFTATQIITDVKAPKRSNRLQEIGRAIDQRDRFIRGFGGALRTGINMMQRISRTKASDAAFFYTLQGYGYFFENGHRTDFADIDPSSRKKDRPLFWISNRFEISITLLNVKPSK